MTLRLVKGKNERPPPILGKCVGCGNALESTKVASLGVSRNGFGWVCHPCRDRHHTPEGVPMLTP